jgi:hypothetical protein
MARGAMTGVETAKPNGFYAVKALRSGSEAMTIDEYGDGAMDHDFGGFTSEQRAY